MTQVETFYYRLKPFEAIQMLFPVFWGNPFSPENYACVLGPSVTISDSLGNTQGWSLCPDWRLAATGLWQHGWVVMPVDNMMFASLVLFHLHA